MVERVTGNILEADVEALVNTVNTVGVMGKGVALQFRQAFPRNYEAYRHAVERGEVKIGKMFVYHLARLTNPCVIINFPTKRHWRQKSRFEDIEAGLESLVEVIRGEKIRSIAVPPLGCGSGGLKWAQVRPRIEKALAALPNLRVLLFEPKGAPLAEKMSIGTEPPKMTPGRAALIGLMRSYVMLGYRLTLLEAQKLAYFLQKAGEPLRLTFVKGKYGPYAQALEHVLQRMEGHFIRGYGDRSRSSMVRLLPGAAEVAEKFLQTKPDTRARLRRVSLLIEGFETPYGMELLATVHWSTEENPAAKNIVSNVVSEVHSWSERKRRAFPPDHVRTAWERLRQQNWL